MNADRRLDARIAKAMGWVGVAERQRVGQGLSTDTVLLGLRRENADTLTEVPRYSLHRDAAWEVWDYISQPGWLIERDANGAYNVFDSHRALEDYRPIGSGETFLLAVCAAALAALEAV